VSGADDERVAGGLDDFAGDGLQLVDLEHAPGLREQAVNEPEVAAGDARDRGDGFDVGEVGRGQCEAELCQWWVRTKSARRC
jgi:hypothetical protein